MCNFLPEHLDRVHAETGEYPSVNQIELHPYFPQAAALAYHEQIGVRTESWSPLGRKWRIVEDPAIIALAAEAGVSPSRLILRWHYQLGTLPLPKSGNPERQRENLDIFPSHCLLNKWRRSARSGAPAVARLTRTRSTTRSSEASPFGGACGNTGCPGALHAGGACVAGSVVSKPGQALPPLTCAAAWSTRLLCV